ncbi:hypothetical protein J6590_050958 [Homalodisca vitripennis]|nr:hypothetical protein J6590_050958 [Homalodisca vitripennis]
MISIASGSLVMFAVGPLVSYELIHYMMLGLCVLFFLLFPLLPESPYYLVMNDDKGGARDTLSWLRENRSALLVEKELLVIENTIMPQLQRKTGSVTLLFSSPGNRRAFLICSTLLALQQLAGISIVMYYMQQIFEMTGADISSSVCSVVVGLIKFGAGFLCPVAVKRLGYKITLILSIFGAGVGMGGLGVFFLLKANNFDVSSLGWLPLLSLAAYIFCFVSGFSNIPWALTGELFPNNVKSIATCLITASSCLGSFITSKLFPSLIELIGIEFLFLICSLFCSLSVIFIALVVEETSDLTFVQIQELLNGRKRKDILMEEQK